MYTQTDRLSYSEAFAYARRTSPLVAAATSPGEEFINRKGIQFYLHQDTFSGFAIRHGELLGVFSIVKGRGDELVKSAIENGTEILDCFDGYLPTFYARHGFKEYKREKNWNPGQPEVVYMRR